MKNVDKCIVCGSYKEHAPLVSFNVDPGALKNKSLKKQPLHYVICRVCGFVYQNPVLYDDGEAKNIYEKSYRTLEYLDKRKNIHVEFLRNNMYRGMSKHFNPNGGKSVLDIGCGEGALLVPFKEDGWDVYGVEPEITTAEFGRKNFCSSITTGFYDKNSFPGKKFGVIILRHVLEHIAQPEKILSDIKENMDDESILFIVVPYILLPKSEGLFGGDHLWLFSYRTLHMFLRKHGFNVIFDLNPTIVFAPARKSNIEIKAFHEDGDDFKVIRKLYNEAFKYRPNNLTEFGKTVVERNVELFHKISGQIPMEIHDGDNSPSCSHETAISTADNIVKKMDSGNLKIIILFGYGHGHLPKALLKKLKNDQRLIVYEDNLSLLKYAFLSLDLCDFLNDKRAVIAINRKILRKHLASFIAETKNAKFLISPNSLLGHDRINKYREIMSSLPRQK